MISLVHQNNGVIRGASYFGKTLVVNSHIVIPQLRSLSIQYRVLGELKAS